MPILQLRTGITWILGLLTLLFLLTGFGITTPGLVESLTFGLLGKARSFQIHSLLWGPFVVTLFLYVYFSCRLEREKENYYC